MYEPWMEHVGPARGPDKLIARYSIPGEGIQLGQTLWSRTNKGLYWQNSFGATGRVTTYCELQI